MRNIVHFEPLIAQRHKTYIRIGIKAYNQHYLHLWPEGDSTPYIESSFTEEVLDKEEQDKNTSLFLINFKKEAVGILKITHNLALDNCSAEDALYVDKIYIIKEATGKSIGKKVLQFISLRAKELNKTIIWLDTMQKGPALNFYLNNGFKKHSESKITFPQAIEAEKPMFIMTKLVSGN